MALAWIIYYAMLVAHVLGGGYTLFRGRAVHRLALLVVALTLLLQLTGVTVLAARHIPLAEGRPNLDLLVNAFEASGLLVLALRYPRENWIIAMMALQSGNMVADAFAFPEDTRELRTAMVNTANLLNIAELSILAWAAAWARYAAGARETPASEEAGAEGQAARGIGSGSVQA